MYARKWSLGALALMLAGSAQMARAQSTDGYHAIQVFPIVVDSASFAQRFHFRATDSFDPTTLDVKFYPAQGTAQALPLTCPSFEVGLGEVRFASLRALCPGLVAGTAFGTLVVSNASSQSFAGFSRVSNPAGNGFSVEAFPANAFTSAVTAVTGLRRLAAQAGAPAFQSNCFVGNLAEMAPAGAPVATEVNLSLSDSAGVLLGQTQVSVQPGQLVRLLDVFAAAGIPAGDVDDAVATFEGFASDAGLLTFCTVQENGSFGADFRIGKQEFAFGGAVPGAQDWSVMRWSFNDAEEGIDNEEFGAPFAIPAGASRNIHLFYFRHPDVITCGLLDVNFEEVTATYGLEMRLRAHDDDGWHVLAGGTNITAFFNLYLGDKARHGGGANTSYQLEVESNGQNTGAIRPYILACFSGSGHSKGELLRKGLGTTF